MTKHVRRKRRRRQPNWHKPPVGAEPGLLTPDPSAPPAQLELIAYSPEQMIETKISSVEEVAALRGRWPMAWLNIVGVQDVGTVERVGRLFNLHPLALEDVRNVHQRPKLEEYPDHLYIVVRLLDHEKQLATEQVSLFVGKDFVVSFLEDPGDCFDPVRRRLRQGKLRIRQGEPDYLAYTLIDAVIDAYFPVVERFSDRLDSVESQVIESPGTEVLHEVQEIKHDLLTLRRTIWPMREVVGALHRQESPLIRAETRIYLRDCYDHTVQLMDLLEMYRELAAGMMDAYLTSLSIRTGEVTKLLTIIATVFIPLTFVAGLYGMNFKTDKSPWNMPELEWYWGYPFVLAVMASVALTMVLYFRRKGWLGARARIGTEDNTANGSISKPSPE